MTELFRSTEFENRTFDLVQLNFFFSSISFDGRTPSNSIKRKSSIEFANRTFDVIRRVCAEHKEKCLFILFVIWGACWPPFFIAN